MPLGCAVRVGLDRDLADALAVVGRRELMTHWPRMLSSDALPDLVGVNVVA